jgi:hypothetical protein
MKPLRRFYVPSLAAPSPTVLGRSQRCEQILGLLFLLVTSRAFKMIEPGRAGR